MSIFWLTLMFVSWWFMGRPRFAVVCLPLWIRITDYRSVWANSRSAQPRRI